MSDLERPSSLSTADRLSPTDIAAETITQLALRLYGLELDPERAAALAQDVSRLIAAAPAPMAAPLAIEAEADFRHLLLRAGRGGDR